MEYHQKEYILSQLLSGYTVVKIKKQPLKLIPPTIQTLFEADSIFQDKLLEARWDGFLSKEQLYIALAENKYWNDEHETQLRGVAQDIETMKEKLFQLIFKSQERMKLRTLLHDAKKVHDELLLKKHAYDYITDEGFASTCKLRHLILSSLYDLSDMFVGNRQLYSEQIENLIGEYNKTSLSNDTVREMARTEPWRSIWNISKNPVDIFNVPVARLTENQKSLIIWSQTYDAIYKSPDCPHDSVIEDDDMLDGWMIVQRKKRETDMGKKEGDEFIKSDKIRNSKEVIILTDSKEGINKVNSLNSAEGKFTKKQRLDYIRNKTDVTEINMPDTKQELIMAQNRASMQAVKGR